VFGIVVNKLLVDLIRNNIKIIFDSEFSYFSRVFVINHPVGLEGEFKINALVFLSQLFQGPRVDHNESAAYVLTKTGVHR